MLYQLCRAGERFEVGDGPIDLTDVDSLILGRGDPQRSRMGKVYVDDPWMSSKHGRVLRDGGRGTGSGRHVVEDMGSTNGVLINGERIEGKARLHHGDLVETGRTFWLFFYEPMTFELPIEPYAFGSWTTWSPRLVYDLDKLQKRIETNKHVLITGPEGSGKGFLARTVHIMSGREGRLVHLDCKERKPHHLVVDLFGAKGQPGRLREADLGTLFLENVDVLPLEVQDMLIDTIKKGGFVPDGKTRRLACESRIVAATATDPAHLVDEGILKRRFLEAVGQIHVDLPSLEDRRPDLGLLLDDFLARARGAPALSREACRSVLMYPWRLNVKAFARVIESAAVLASGRGKLAAKGGRVELEHLPVEVVGKDALRALIPADEELDRPPSVQAPMDGHGFVDRASEDPEKTEFRAGTKSEVIPSSDSADVAEAFEEDQYTDQLPSQRVRPLVDDETSMPFEEDVTDPTVARPPPQREPSSLPPEMSSDQVSPAVRALDPSDPGAGFSSEERPPSAYYALESMERSYASAVDPDLIVDALLRARGNVSAAARYLGKPRATLLRWINEFQLNADDYRDG